MARSPRITNPGNPTVYHLISRTTLLGFPMGEVEKDSFVELVRKFSRIYFVEVLGFCCMDNHFHLLVRMFPESDYTDEEVGERFSYCYGPYRKLMAGQIPHFRERWSNISEYMKDVKLGFTRYFNRRHDHKGYFWADRFKSVIVEDGDALLNCLAYIDLNPVRAGLVDRPENYRWSSIGWHVQTGNKGGFLSSDLGMGEYGEWMTSERLRNYRKFLYEVGSLDRGKGALMPPDIVDQERRNDYEISHLNHFLYRTRYFTDSGIIGSKKFVSQIYDSIKHRLPSKRKKSPQPIEGMEGIYSLKRITENN